ncbi:MAG: hypothetical protein U0X76_03655 [Bacteroidia bacterium]
MSPWPAQADGLGYTCELLSQSGDPNDGTNWFAGCIGGSPGRAFSASLQRRLPFQEIQHSAQHIQLSATSVIGYTYQWKRNNVNISGANSPNYTATQAGTYTVAVTYQGCSVITSPFVVTTVTQSLSPVVTGASLRRTWFNDTFWQQLLIQFSGSMHRMEIYSEQEPVL